MALECQQDTCTFKDVTPDDIFGGAGLENGSGQECPLAESAVVVLCEHCVIASKERTKMVCECATLLVTRRHRCGTRGKACLRSDVDAKSYMPSGSFVSYTRSCA